ncbi:MAG: alpha/beta hydrolase [Comamonadaceae bacterium]|nr:alpha/beta hydrolase [Comamonadaceae bacterium]
MKQVDIDGVFLEVAQIHAPTGAVPELAPLVFLHEGLGSVAMWRDWPASLCAATGRAGWVYSRQGYGQSSPVADVRGPSHQDLGGQRSGRLKPDYMHREALEVLPSLLKKLGVERPVLLGHSDGATIALLHAARNAVSACVVLAPHLFVEDVSVKSIEEARDAFEATNLRERLSRYHRDVDVAFWQWNDIWLSPDFRHFDIREECKSIEAPLLAIQGVDDAYGTLTQLDELQRAVPHARKLVLPQCGHSPHRDQPEAVNGAIVQFLDTDSRPGQRVPASPKPQ